MLRRTLDLCGCLGGLLRGSVREMCWEAMVCKLMLGWNLLLRLREWCGGLGLV